MHQGPPQPQQCLLAQLGTVYKLSLGINATVIINYSLWVYFVCNFLHNTRIKFKGQSMGEVLWKAIKFCPLESINFVLTPRITPVGGTTIDVKYILQLRACLHESN